MFANANIYMYILGVLTEKPYEALGRNVVYIPISTSSHAPSVTQK